MYVEVAHLRVHTSTSENIHNIHTLAGFAACAVTTYGKVRRRQGKPFRKRGIFQGEAARPEKHGTTAPVRGEGPPWSAGLLACIADHVHGGLGARL